MKKQLTLAGLALCLALPACSYENRYHDGHGGYANDDSWNKDRMARMEEKNHYFFDKMDTNGDGYISRAEQRNFSDRMFRNSDTNRDGLVSYEEFSAMKRAEWQDMKAGRDAAVTSDTTVTTTESNY